MGKLKILFPLIILLIITLTPASASDIQRCALCHSKIAQNFTKSLHYTINGIKLGWSQGAGKDFNMSMPKVCMECHIENCSKCHVYHGYIPNMTTCIDCHEHKIGVNYSEAGFMETFRGGNPKAITLNVSFAERLMKTSDDWTATWDNAKDKRAKYKDKNDNGVKGDF